MEPCPTLAWVLLLSLITDWLKTVHSRDFIATDIIYLHPSTAAVKSRSCASTPTSPHESHGLGGLVPQRELSRGPVLRDGRGNLGILKGVMSYTVTVSGVSSLGRRAAFSDDRGLLFDGFRGGIISRRDKPSPRPKQDQQRGRSVSGLSGRLCAASEVWTTLRSPAVRADGNSANNPAARPQQMAQPCSFSLFGSETTACEPVLVLYSCQSAAFSEPRDSGFFNPNAEATPYPGGFKCFTCENATDNYECNRWAPDLYCPREARYCFTSHRMDSRGESLSVTKRCVPLEDCLSTGCAALSPEGHKVREAGLSADRAQRFPQRVLCWDGTHCSSTPENQKQPTNVNTI
ncbi:LYPD6 protein, partial [Atractosteus spatula]|nr:LYPD6 protein [Atractosteus spatula]